MSIKLEIRKNIITILVSLSFLSFGVISMYSFFNNSNCIVKENYTCMDDKYLTLYKKLSNLSSETLKGINKKELINFILHEILQPYIQKDLGIEISEEVVIEKIKKYPIFLENDEFQETNYNNFLKNRNITEEEFIYEIRNIIANELFYDILKNSIDKKLIEKKINLIKTYNKKYIIKKESINLRSELEKINIKYSEIEEEFNKNPKYKQKYSLKQEIEIPTVIFYEGKEVKITNLNLEEIKRFLEDKDKSGKLEKIQKRLRIKNAIKSSKIVIENDIYNEQPATEIRNFNTESKILSIITKTEEFVPIENFKQTIINDLKRKKILNLDTKELEKLKVKKEIITTYYNPFLERNKENDILKRIENKESKFRLEEKDTLTRFTLESEISYPFVQNSNLTEELEAKERNRTEKIYKEYILQKYNIKVDFNRIINLLIKQE